MSGVSPEALLQLALAVLCGGAIGVEREVRGRAAGLRTMILVCLGATLAMIVSNDLVSPTRDVQTTIMRVDPSRIAAGIVTGIGFLGGAVVVKLGDLVRGVTTAASIWLAASLGIVIGQRFYVLAVLGVLVALAVLAIFDRFDQLLPQPIYRKVAITVGRAHAGAAERDARAAFDRVKARIMDVEAESDGAADTLSLTFQVRVDRSVDVRAVVETLAGLEGCRRASWASVA